MSGGAAERAAAGAPRLDAGLLDRIEQLFLRERHAACLAAVEAALAAAEGEAGASALSPAEGEAPPAEAEPAGAGVEAAVADLVLRKAWCLYALGRDDDLRAWLGRATARGWLAGDDPRARLIGAWADVRRGRYDEALRLGRGLTRALAGSLDPLLPEYLYLVAACLTHLGRLPEAERVCVAANGLFALLEQRREEAETCNLVGAICTRLSRYDEALRHYERARRLNRDLRRPRRLAESHLNIGVTLYKLGRYAAAAEQLERALALTSRRPADSVHYRAEIALGNVCRLRGDPVAARRHLMAAYSVVTRERIPREECLSLEFLGDVLRDEGKPAEARRYYGRALAIARGLSPEGDLVCEILRRQGECLGREGRLDEAEPLLARAGDLARRLGDRFEEGAALRCRAEVALARRDHEAARRLAAGAGRLLREIGARHEAAISALVAARALLALAGRPVARSASLREEAWREALRAQHEFLALGLQEWLGRVDEVLAAVARERFRPVAPASASRDAPRIVAASGALREVLRLCDAVAACEEPVLLTGETGTGKELLARRIHALSPRREGPLVCVNVAAVPATLFEREFFGHSRGAFSGADRDRPGYAAAAAGGTLFLDEIADLPPELQPKLLRLLQEGSYSALGDPRPRRADVRLVAATNADLARLVEQGRFRRDLWYRLRTLEVDLPPLRERPQDVLPLLDHFLTEAAGAPLRAADCFDRASLRALRRYGWPGNAREVAMVARRARLGLVTEGRVRIVLTARGRQIVLKGPGEGGRLRAGPDLRGGLLALLAETGGNKSEVARRLGISRPTLYRWLRRLGISG